MIRIIVSCCFFVTLVQTSNADLMVTDANYAGLVQNPTGLDILADPTTPTSLIISSDAPFDDTTRVDFLALGVGQAAISGSTSGDAFLFPGENPRFEGGIESFFNSEPIVDPAPDPPPSLNYLVQVEGRVSVNGVGRASAFVQLFGDTLVQRTAGLFCSPVAPCPNPTDSFMETVTVTKTAGEDLRVIQVINGSRDANAPDEQVTAFIDPIVSLDSTQMIMHMGVPTPADQLYQVVFSSNLISVPEPSSFAFLGLVGVALVGCQWKKRNR